MKLTIDVRWDNNDGADKICKQLGYEEGVKGPRNAVSKGSGPIHIVSRAASDYKADVINETYKLCTHTIDQAVACKGGLGAISGETTIFLGSHKNTAQCTNHEQPQLGCNCNRRYRMLFKISQPNRNRTLFCDHFAVIFE